MSDGDRNGQRIERVLVTRFGAVVHDWPTWLLVILFLALAGVFALAGVLDDWIRAALAFLFVAVGLTLAARVFKERSDAG